MFAISDLKRIQSLNHDIATVSRVQLILTDATRESWKDLPKQKKYFKEIET